MPVLTMFAPLAYRGAPFTRKMKVRPLGSDPVVHVNKYREEWGVKCREEGGVKCREGLGVKCRDQQDSNSPYLF
jgi:hypothetical protein